MRLQDRITRFVPTNAEHIRAVLTAFEAEGIQFNVSPRSSQPNIGTVM